MSRGDRSAVADFYERYFPLLYHTAKKTLGRDEQTCLDVVQDATIKIIRLVKPVPCEAQLVAWLKAVVQSTAYDWLRGEQRRKNREAATLPPEQRDGAELAEQIAWLRSQLAAMDPELVRLIDLKFDAGWTLAKIGQALGLSIGTIDGRLRRAIGRLRNDAKALEADRR